METKEQVLYAIRNGGFSSGPMPQNIVVGKEAEQVAEVRREVLGPSEAGPLAQPGQRGAGRRPPGDTSE